MYIILREFRISIAKASHTVLVAFYYVSYLHIMYSYIVLR